MANQASGMNTDFSDSEEERSSQDDLNKIQDLKGKGHSVGAAQKALDALKITSQNEPIKPPPSPPPPLLTYIKEPSPSVIKPVVKPQKPVSPERMITIPPNTKVLDFIKQKFPNYQITRMLKGAEDLFTEDYVESFVSCLRRNNMKESEFLNNLQGLNFALWNLTHGYAMGQNHAQLQIKNELINLKKDLKETRELMADIIGTFSVNTSKFQTECSSVSADLRSLVQRVEKTFIQAETRKAPQATLYKSTKGIQSTEVVFLCCGYESKVTYQMTGEINIDLKGWSDLPITKEAAISFGTSLKLVDKATTKRMRNKECGHIIKHYALKMANDEAKDPSLLEALINHYADKK